MKKAFPYLIIVLLLTYVVIDAITPRSGSALQGSGLQAPERLQRSTSDRFTVATYNIRRGQGDDGVRDISRAAGVLREAGAEIIGLNELSGTLFYGLADQAQQLADLLDMSWLFAETENTWYQSYFGNGLLSVYPVAYWAIHPLFANKEESRSLRNVIIADIPIAGTSVHFLITHLDRGAVRARQLDLLLQAFRDLPEPAILLGDLNTVVTDPQFGPFLAEPGIDDAVRLALGEQVPRVDWIVSKGLDIVSGGMQERGISDHAAFWVEFRLRTDGLACEPDASDE